MPILRADYLLRALPLAAGSHLVVFTYEPWSFRIGLWAMLATLAVLPGLIGRGRRSGTGSMPVNSDHGLEGHATFEARPPELDEAPTDERE